MYEYTCRKCGVIVRSGGFVPLRLCGLCSESIPPEDKRVVSEFAETLRLAKEAKTPKERATVLLEADRRAKEGEPAK